MLTCVYGDLWAEERFDSKWSPVIILWASLFLHYAQSHPIGVRFSKISNLVLAGPLRAVLLTV